MKLTIKESLSLSLILSLILLANIFIAWQNFKEFKQTNQIYIRKVLVEQSYIKHKKKRTYRVLKLKYKDFTIYTVKKANTDFRQGQLINMSLNITRVDFLNYLKKVFYAPSYNYTVVGEKNLGFKGFFINQHKHEWMRELYGGLYFAMPMSKSLRSAIATFGVSHLVAISGYHLGLIFAILFFLLKFIYGYFHKRYFPYRNLSFDLSLIIFALLFGYAYILGFVPSFVRSLVMALFAFFLILKNIKLFSFENLFFCVFLCIALFPRLGLSLGFFFSILGVFYIFLFMHHFRLKNAFEIVFLNCFVFLGVLLPVHYYYPQAGILQLMSLPLSLLFVIFYPLSFTLHLFYLGDIFDPFLLKWLKYPFKLTNFYTPNLVFYSYLCLSILAIKSRLLTIFLLGFTLIYFLFMLFK